jgi:hypothetical protein
VAEEAAAVSVAGTIATATNRDEQPSRKIDGALLLKRPITASLSSKSAPTIAVVLNFVPSSAYSKYMKPIDLSDETDGQQIKFFLYVMNHLSHASSRPPYRCCL